MNAFLAHVLLLASDATAKAGEHASAGAHAADTAHHEPSGLHNFLEILTKPDNIPIVAMLFLVIYFFGLSLKMGLENDRLAEKGEKDKIYDRMNKWVFGETEEEGG
jgi:hypothetical protein